jgi:hypothetical protein
MTPPSKRANQPADQPDPPAKPDPRPTPAPVASDVPAATEPPPPEPPPPGAPRAVSRPVPGEPRGGDVAASAGPRTPEVRAPDRPAGRSAARRDSGPRRAAGNGGNGGHGNGGKGGNGADGGNGGNGANGGNGGNGVVVPAPDFPFPIVTQEFSRRAATPDSDPGPLAIQSIGDVLGWRVRTEDPKAFLAALTGSFTLHKVEGHTEARWTPRGFAVQADMGAVTGGQASLAARARATIREALPLLDALTPLDPAADPEDCAAVRGLVRFDVEELQKELQSPLLRLPRVDLIFARLTGFDPGDGDVAGLVTATTVGGHLADLARELGIFTGSVNTLDEERNQTSFITLVDWIAGLLASWEDQRVELDPWSGHNAFLGSTLTVLGGQLAALADQVEEVKVSLDSVLIDAGERQALRLADPPITLDGLLTWIEEFALYEGKRVIDVGGRAGILTAFLPTVEKLYEAVNVAIGWTPQERTSRARRGSLGRGRGATGGGSDGPVQFGCGGILPTGFETARVRVAFESLQDRLFDIRCLARGAAHRPTIVEIPAPAVGISFGLDTESAVGTVESTVEARDFDQARHEFALVQPDGLVVSAEVTRLGGDLWRVTFEDVDLEGDGDVVEIQIRELGTLRRLDVADVVVEQS